MLILNQIQNQLLDPNLQTFFFDEYLTQFQSAVRVNATTEVPYGYSLLDLTNPNYGMPLFWKTSPATFRNSTGYFVNSGGGYVVLASLTGFVPYSFITTGSIVEFASSSLVDSVWVPNLSTQVAAPVNSVIQNGVPLDPTISNIGPVELGIQVQNLYEAIMVYPAFRTSLNQSEINAITAAINAGISFWLYYDLINNVWGVSTFVGLVPNPVQQPFIYPPPSTGIYSNFAVAPNSWMIYVQITSSNQTGFSTYTVTNRGRVFVFESYRNVRFYWEPNEVIIDNSTGLALQDTIEVMPWINTNNTIDNNNPGSVENNLIPDTNQSQVPFLSVPVTFNITGTYIDDDGYQDTSKVQVSLVDSNGDNIPDQPNGFDMIVSTTDTIVFEYYQDEITSYQGTRPWIATWGQTLQNITGTLYVHFPVDPDNPTLLYGVPFISNSPTWADPTNPSTFNGTILYLDQPDLIFLNNDLQLEFGNGYPITIANQVTAFFNGPTPNALSAYPWLAGTLDVANKQTIMSSYFLDKSFFITYDQFNNAYQPGYGVYKVLEFQASNNTNMFPTGQILVGADDEEHFDKNGKTFTQNETIPVINQQPFYFKWSHYSPIDQRIDPAPSNIIDMVVLVDSYYQQMLVWASQNGTLATMPAAPTTEDLRINFSNLDQYKMVSDTMIWNSGTFKILFGSQAAPQLQATFLVVKAPATNVSDQVVKTQVVQAVNAYFAIANWDFGETFYFSELGAYIHQQLSTIISSVVITSNNPNSSFGNLFEIQAGPTELFLSTLQVSNVLVVNNLTMANLNN